MAIHKLVGVTMLVFIVWSAMVTHRATGLAPSAWVVVALAAATFVMLIGTGSALSAMTSPPSVIQWAHKIAPYLSIPLTGLWLYMQ
jgi:hypothetical protein